MAKKKAAAKKSKAPAKRESTAAVLKHYMAGASLEELKKKFGIRGKGHLATAVMDGLIKIGKLPPLIVRKSGAGANDIVVSVNKRGTIILPKSAVVETFKARTGQTFTVSRRGKKIILTSKS